MTGCHEFTFKQYENNMGKREIGGSIAETRLVTGVPFLKLGDRCTVGGRRAYTSLCFSMF